MVTKEQLEEYQKAYSQGKSLISDEEYDQLLEEYLNKNGENNRPFMRNKQSAAVNDVVGTIPKVYGVKHPMREGQKTYMDWITKMEKNGKFSSGQMVCVQCKLDGCSIAYDVETERYFTRGDYDNGESVDVTDIMSKAIDWFKMNRIDGVKAVKYEAILPLEHFEFDCFKQYKRPRDAVAACITSRNKEDMKWIYLIPLRYYMKDGSMRISNFVMNYMCQFMQYNDDRQLQNFISALLRNNACASAPDWFEGYDMFYECDGVVVTAVESEKLSVLTKSRDEIAIKILNNTKATKLKNVEWQYGKTGRITPVAIVDPVMFNNVTVDHIGLSTFERVINMNLKIGDTVNVAYNIVPYMLNSEHDGEYPISIPRQCPMCGADLDLRVVKQIRCTNPQCVGKKLGDIIRYAEKMKMMGLSKGIITELYDQGYLSDISDLYHLDYDEIKTLNGFGDRSVNNIKKAITDASTNISIDRWLGALPCLDVSAKTWKTLLTAIYNGDMSQATKTLVTDMKNDNVDQFLEDVLWYVNGIGPATIRAINEGIRNNWDIIIEICKYITFDMSQTSSSKFTKGQVAMTGIRDQYLKEELQKCGYEVLDNFTSKCVALIIRDKDFTSTKVFRAKELRIPIYTVTEAYDALIK